MSQTQRSRVAPTLFAAVALTLVACTPRAPASPSASPGTTSPPSATAADCGSLDLLDPSGERIDLTGTWQTEVWTFRAGTYYLQQIGHCLWWAGGFPMLVDDPNFGPTGQTTTVFRGEIRNDFTIVGDWTDVHRECILVTVVACYGGPGRPGTGGTITLLIEFPEAGSPRLLYVSGTGEPFNTLLGGANQRWARVGDSGGVLPPAP